jgi:hypothetical protein
MSNFKLHRWTQAVPTPQDLGNNRFPTTAAASGLVEPHVSVMLLAVDVPIWRETEDTQQRAVHMSQSDSVG